MMGVGGEGLSGGAMAAASGGGA
eukprot:COSAG01_NODE_43690_length_427_cov_0.920732_1_plen_22_part_10